jgi:hypothetical protein
MPIPTGSADAKRPFRGWGKVARVAVAAFFALTAGPAWAVTCTTSNTCTLNESAEIGFLPTITITKNSDIDFGTVKRGACTYTINTSGTISGTPSGSCSALSGTPSVGSLTIRGSSSQTITISAGSYTAASTVTPSAATGKYNNGSEVSFPMNNVSAPTSTGKTLLLGVTLTTAGSEADLTTYQPTFTISVVYP